jgi:hypothetical protein
MALREVKRFLPSLQTVLAERGIDDEQLLVLEQKLEEARIGLEAGEASGVNLDSLFEQLFSLRQGALSSVRVVVPDFGRPPRAPGGEPRPGGERRPPDGGAPDGGPQD